MIDAAAKAEVLAEALPYIRRFAGKVAVIKYGGHAIGDETAVESFAEDVLLLHAVGIRPVVVHGGGPQIGEHMAGMGLVPSFVDGLRVTDGETLNVVRLVLVGKVNGEIVRALNRYGDVAIGLSGEDGGLIRAKPRDSRLGFVGDVESVDRAVLDRLMASGRIPVVATLGVDGDGQAYNINADTAAGAIAVSLRADKLVYLTDVDGVRARADDPETRISQARPADLDRLIDEGIASAGMIPKVAACAHAVRGGVAAAHVLDGKNPHALLVELFTDEGVGTMVTA